MPNDIIPGFYGKLPSMGDFVSRRLPPDFVKPWDRWLREALFDSKSRLGKHFRDRFLAGPAWRFVLGPGNCGRYCVAGIIAPSFDKVGRCFPLTIAVVAADPLTHLLLRAAQWFSQLEIIAGLLKNDKLDLKTFDAQLQRQKLPAALFKSRERIEANILSPVNDPLFLKLQMDNPHQIPEAFEYLTTHLMVRHLTAYSVWCTSRIDKKNATLSVFRGLPPTDRYVQFF